jgi:hypothetical protein
METSSVGELLMIEEIEARYDGEWVLLVDRESTPLHEVKRGRLVCHSKEKDELHRVAMQLRPKRAAILFIGHGPEDVEYVL